MSTGSENRKRKKLVALRLTDEEHQELHKRCDDYGLSVGELMRIQCLDHPMPQRKRKKATEDVKAVAQLLGYMGKVGSNLNQIAKHLNQGEGVMVDELRQGLKDVSEMRDACMKALGQKP